MGEWFDDSPVSISAGFNPALPSSWATSWFTNDFNEIAPDGGDRPIDHLLSEPSGRSRSWFLGLDIGTTGISAVLLNRATRSLFPLYWHAAEPSSAPDSAQRRGRRWFRLPAIASGDRPIPPTSFHPSGHARSAQGDPEQAPRQMYPMKLFLALGIPYVAADNRHWEPLIQWSTTKAMPLHWFRQALQALIGTLTQSASAESWRARLAATHPSKVVQPSLVCGAVGLGDEQLQDALRQLGCVIVGCPSGWPDAYGVNIREALIKTQLIDHPSQLAIVPEAIAIILSGLRYSDGESVQSPVHAPPSFAHTDSTGATLAISAGATVTDLALLQLPDDVQELSQPAFHIRSLAFGGSALDQDIFSQLLLPLVRDSGAMPALSNDNTPHSPLRDSLRLSVEPADWQAIAAMGWSCPPAGQPAVAERIRLQQLLNHSIAGQRFLSLAQTLKRELQHYEQCTLAVGETEYPIHRQALGNLVFIPFLETLKWSILQLLHTSSIAEEDIRQVVCSGGTASLRVIALWLRKRFPRATIIQDNYGVPQGELDDRALTSQESQCSRVAYGLATLPLHAQLFSQAMELDDYAVLNALLSVMAHEPMSISTILQKLTEYGIRGDRHYAKILRLLNGYLPPGLNSGRETDGWIAARSRLSLVSASARLFERKSPNSFKINQRVKALIQERLNTLRDMLYSSAVQQTNYSDWK